MRDYRGQGDDALNQEIFSRREGITGGFRDQEAHPKLTRMLVRPKPLPYFPAKS